MPIPGNLLTTAMAVMPHIDVDQALKTALSMDIPFWPFKLCSELLTCGSVHIEKC